MLNWLKRLFGRKPKRSAADLAMVELINRGPLLYLIEKAGIDQDNYYFHAEGRLEGRKETATRQLGETIKRHKEKEEMAHYPESVSPPRTLTARTAPTLVSIIGGRNKTLNT